MDATKDNTAQIGTAIETLTRQVTSTWQQKLVDLRAKIDQQFATLESAVDQNAHAGLVAATVKQISGAATDQAQLVRRQAEAAASQALGAIEAELRGRLSAANEANASLRTALEAANKELAATKKTLEDQKSADQAGKQRLKELEVVNQRLSEALSKLLRGRETAPSASRAVAGKPNAPVAPVAPNAPIAPTSAPGATAGKPVAPVASAKPLQFSTPARDAKRVKIRRGITVDVDGVPGELVDLSLGGAQTLLRLAVRPNQLVRVVIPGATGQMICRGRIVWSVYEQPQTSVAVYRTGVKFSDVDTAAIERFMRDYEDRASLQATGSGH